VYGGRDQARSTTWRRVTGAEHPTQTNASSAASDDDTQKTRCGGTELVGPYVMAQLGHTDPAFTLRLYAHAMRRDEGDKEALKALVDGRHWAPAAPMTPRSRRER
jgi:hypothetical protein